MRIDWFTFAAQVVNFLVLVYLLKRFLYAPVTAAMQAREDQIAEQLDEAVRSQQQADLLIEDYRERKQQLEREQHRMFDEVKREVESSRQQLLKQARIDVGNRRDDWLASLDSERETLAQIVKQRCSEQITAATRQAVRHLADADLEEQMLRAFIQRLGEEQTQRKVVADRNGKAKATAYSAFEISTIWRERIKDVLRQQFSIETVDFETDSEIVCGLEVHFGSQKIGWSVSEYLASLEEQFDKLVQHPTP